MRDSWIHRLRPHTDVVSHLSADPKILEQARELFGADPVRWAAEVGAGLAAELQRSATASGCAVTALRGVETELLGLLIQLYERRPLAHFQVSEAALDYARVLARDEVPSAVLIDAVWRRHACVQEAMIATLGDDADSVPNRSGWDDLLLLTRYSERAAAQLLAAHDGADRWFDERAARRTEAVGRLMIGESTSREDEDLIGVRLGGHHLVAVAIGVDADDARVATLAREVSGVLRGGAPVVLDRSGETVLWWSRSQPMRCEDLRQVGSIAVPNGLTFAFGDPHSGAAGVAQAYAEALRAVKVAAAAGQPRVWLHADALLTSVLMADRAAVRELVARELSGVLGRDRRSVETRQTLLLFLRSGGSRQAVAQQLGVAPTTVAYRVDRFERLRERPLHESRLETWVALSVVDLVPSLLEDLSDNAG